MADERYRAVLGLEADVERGLVRWQSGWDQAVAIAARGGVAMEAAVAGNPAAFAARGMLSGQAFGRGFASGMRGPIAAAMAELRAMVATLNAAQAALPARPGQLALPAPPGRGTGLPPPGMPGQGGLPGGGPWYSWGGGRGTGYGSWVPPVGGPPAPRGPWPTPAPGGPGPWPYGPGGPRAPGGPGGPGGPPRPPWPTPPFGGGPAGGFPPMAGGSGGAGLFGRVPHILGMTLAYTVMFGLVRALGQAAQQFVELERATIEFDTTAEAVSGHVDGLANSIIKLSASAGTAPAAGLEAARRGIGTFANDIKAGLVSVNEAARVSAEIGTRAGVLTGQDVGVSTDELQTAAQAFGLGVGGQTAILDTATNAFHRFGVSQQTVLQAMSRGAQVAQEAGIAYDQYGGIVALVGRQTNRSGDDIARGVNRVLQNLREPETQLFLRGAGVDTSTAIPDQIKQLADAYNQMSETQRAELVQQLGGAEVQPIVIAMLSQYAEVLEFVDYNQRNAGASAREFNKLMNSIGGTIRQIGAQFDRLLQGLAQSGMLDPFFALLRLLVPILNGASALVDVFNQIPRPIRTALFAILELSLAVRALRAVGALGGLRSALFGGAAPGAAGGLAGAWRGTSGILGPLGQQIRAGYQGVPLYGPAGQTLLGATGGGLRGAMAGAVQGAGGLRALTNQATSAIAPYGPALAVTGAIVTLGALVSAYEEHRSAIEDVARAERAMAEAATADQLKSALNERQAASERLQNSFDNPLNRVLLGLTELGHYLGVAAGAAAAFAAFVTGIPSILEDLGKNIPGREILGAAAESVGLGGLTMPSGADLLTYGATIGLPGGPALASFANRLVGGRKAKEDADRKRDEAELQRRIIAFEHGHAPEATFGDLSGPDIEAGFQGLASAGATASRQLFEFDLDYQRQGGRFPSTAAAESYIKQVIPLAQQMRQETLTRTGGDEVAAAQAELAELDKVWARTALDDGFQREQLELARQAAAKGLADALTQRARLQADLLKAQLPAEARIARANIDLAQADRELANARATGSPDDVLKAQAVRAQAAQEREQAIVGYQEAQRLRAAGLDPTRQLQAQLGNTYATIMRLGATPAGRQSAEFEQAILQAQQLSQQIALGKLETAQNIALAGTDPRDQLAVLKIQYETAYAKMVAQAKAGDETGAASTAVEVTNLANQYNAVYVRGLQAQNLAKVFPGDAVGAADAAVKNARLAIRFQSNDIEERANNERALAEALAQRRQALLEYASAVRRGRIDDTNPVQVAREETRLARERYEAEVRAGAPRTKTEPMKREWEAARQRELDAAFQQRFSDMQIAEELGRISHGAYIRYLQSEHDRLTREIKATRANTEGRRRLIDERNQIDQALKAAREELTGQWNLGEIKVPTPYEVRRYIQTQAAGAPYGANYQMQNNRYVDYPGQAFAAMTQGLSIGTNNVAVNINGGSVAAITRTVIAAVRGELRTAAAATGTRGRKR